MGLRARRKTFDGASSFYKKLILVKVVISGMDENSGVLIRYDIGKIVREGLFVRTGSLNRPSSDLLNAVNTP